MPASIIAFINAELERLGQPAVDQNRVVDTLAIAKRKHPMGPNSLDALCRRYGIDNSHRTKHGALLDSELLAEVYIELIGGKQAALGLETASSGLGCRDRDQTVEIVIRQRPAPLAPRSDRRGTRRTQPAGQGTRRKGDMAADGRQGGRATDAGALTVCVDPLSYLANFRAPKTHRITADGDQQHRPCDGFAEQRRGDGQPEERLQQLQLADGGDAALGKAAIPEDEADKHAEDRHVGQADPCRRPIPAKDGAW